MANGQTTSSVDLGSVPSKNAPVPNAPVTVVDPGGHISGPSFRSAPARVTLPLIPSGDGTVTVRSPNGKLFDLPRAQLPKAISQGFQVQDPKTSAAATSLPSRVWKDIWTPLSSGKDVSEGLKQETMGAFNPELMDAATNKEIEQGNPVRAALFSFAGGTERSVANLASSFTSPGSLVLFALSGGESVIAKAFPEAKVLLTALRVPQQAAMAGFGLQGAVQAATPRQPNESNADAIERRLYGLSATVGAAAAVGTSARAMQARFLRRYFGLNDDLASKVYKQTQEISSVKDRNIRQVGDASIQANQQIVPVVDALFNDMKQVGIETDDTIAKIKSRTNAQLAEAKGKLTVLDQAKLSAGANVVSDALQAMLKEQARVSQPFQEMGENIEDPVSTSGSVRNLINQDAIDKGVRLEELPSAAFRAIDVQNDLSVSFNDLTRIRGDIYEAADFAKDGSVKSALMSSYDKLTDMQEKAADRENLGTQYRTAKAEYSKFKRGLGSGMMQDWLSARDAQEQAIAPKVAKLFSPSTAEALRTVLKAAGVDVSPIDAILQATKETRESIRRLPQESKGDIAEARKTVAEQTKNLRQETSRRVGSIKSEYKERIRELARKTRASVNELEGRGKIVPDRTTSDLAGKSNEQLLVERLRAQASRMEAGGMRNPMSLTMTVYGLVRLASGSVFGMFPLSYGVTRGELPSLLANPRFQDWVIEKSGVTGNAAQMKVRRGLMALRPTIDKMVRSGTLEQGTVQASKTAASSQRPANQ